MKLSFLAAGATCRTYVEAVIKDGKIIMSTGRELTWYEWKTLRYRIEASSLCEHGAVTEWIRSWRLR